MADWEIVQMTSCNDGWRAVFADREGSTWETRIAMWLLVVSPEGQAVHPGVALGGEICNATQVHNYLGVVSPDETRELFAAEAVAHAAEADRKFAASV